MGRRLLAHKSDLLRISVVEQFRFMLYIFAITVCSTTRQVVTLTSSNQGVILDIENCKPLPAVV